MPSAEQVSPSPYSQLICERLAVAFAVDVQDVLGRSAQVIFRLALAEWVEAMHRHRFG